MQSVTSGQTRKWLHATGAFTQRINVNAPKEKLYNAFATRAGMESWFLRMWNKHFNATLLQNEEQVHPRDTYRWIWHGWPDTTVESGEFLLANGKDRLQFVFGKAGTVIVKISEAEGKTWLSSRRNISRSDEESKFNFHVGCITGWVFYLANLKSIMEGGIDLSNKNEKLTGVLNSDTLFIGILGYMGEQVGMMRSAFNLIILILLLSISNLLILSLNYS